MTTTYTVRSYKDGKALVMQLELPFQIRSDETGGFITYKDRALALVDLDLVFDLPSLDGSETIVTIIGKPKILADALREARLVFK